jgi:hypothetical protein
MDKIQTITQRTDSEWPKDHALRKYVDTILPDDKLHTATYLVCNYYGSERLPLSEGFIDEFCNCIKCNAELVRRTDAPKHLKPICFPCWNSL